MPENTEKIHRFTLSDKVRKYLSELQVVDYRIIVSIVFLMTFGLLMVYSASGASASMFLKQLLIGVAGFALMIFVSYIDYHIYAEHAELFFLASLGLVLLCKLPGVGVERNGAYRWIQLGPMQFQPSELLKPTLVFFMAFILVRMGSKLRKIHGVAWAMLPAIASAGLVTIWTSDLSTGILIAGIASIMFFVAHPNKTVWLWVGLAIVVIAGVLFYFNYRVAMELAMPQESGQNYRMVRVLSFLFPEMFPEQARQQTYSLYSIGFGGILGRGLGRGTMKYYLSDQYNDFIFAVIAEELGIVGCVAILFLYWYQVWRILTVGKFARDRLGSYMAIGIGAHIALQVILHVAVGTHLVPNTGISLPYISYGGTALLLLLCEVGVVLNISRQIPGKRVKVGGAGANQDMTERRIKQRKTA